MYVNYIKPYEVYITSTWGKIILKLLMKKKTGVSLAQFSFTLK